MLFSVTIFLMFVNKLSISKLMESYGIKKEGVKQSLESLIPKKDWYIVNLGLVQFGREVCRPINPKCNVCPMSKYCDYYKNSLNFLHRL